MSKPSQEAGPGRGEMTVGSRCGVVDTPPSRAWRSRPAAWRGVKPKPSSRRNRTREHRPAVKGPGRGVPAFAPPALTLPRAAPSQLGVIKRLPVQWGPLPFCNNCARRTAECQPWQMPPPKGSPRGPPVGWGEVEWGGAGRSRAGWGGPRRTHRLQYSTRFHIQKNRNNTIIRSSVKRPRCQCAVLPADHAHALPSPAPRTHKQRPGT